MPGSERTPFTIQQSWNKRWLNKCQQKRVKCCSNILNVTTQREWICSAWLWTTGGRKKAIGFSQAIYYKDPLRILSGSSQDPLRILSGSRQVWKGPFGIFYQKWLFCILAKKSVSWINAKPRFSKPPIPKICRFFLSAASRLDWMQNVHFVARFLKTSWPG